MAVQKRRKMTFKSAIRSIEVISFIAFYTLIIFICGLLFWRATRNFFEDNQKMNDKLDKISKKVNELQGNLGCDQLSVAITKIDENLLLATKDFSQENTITFMFNIFSVTLIAGGAYLIKRYRIDTADIGDNVIEFNQQLNIINKEMQNYSKIVTVLNTINSNLSLAYIITESVKPTDRYSKIERSIIMLRDLIDTIKKAFIQADNDNIQISKEIIESYKALINDMIGKKTKLSSKEIKAMSIVTKLYEINDLINKLLKKKSSLET